MHSFPDLVRPLRSERVTLRFESERDIPEVLIAHQDDPTLHARLGLHRPPSGAELGRRVERAAAERAAGNIVRFTILEPGSDVCRGQLDVHRVDWHDLRAEAGIWVAPGFRGRGLGSAALRLGAAWLFDVCGLERLELLTEPDNAAMIAAAKAAGLVEEGVLRAYVNERDRRVGPDDPVAAAGRLGGRMKEWRVPLPDGVRTPFEVYVNGVPQELGTDYRVSEGELVFARELVSQKLGLRAWLLGFWGIGTYKRNDEIDVRYELNGQPMLAHALEIRPPG